MTEQRRDPMENAIAKLRAEIRHALAIMPVRGAEKLQWHETAKQALAETTLEDLRTTRGATDAEQRRERSAPHTEAHPIIDDIPEGAQVMVYTAHGAAFLGTDDTTAEEAARGLFVLFDVSNGQSTRTVMRRADVVAYANRYTAV